VSFREEEHPVLLPSYRRVVGAAKAASRFNERLQYRFEIEGRAADDLEHVGGSSLLPERLAQLLRARLHLLEQPHVLDRDDRLVGEGSDEVDLLVGEGMHLFAPQNDYADGRVFAHKRDAQSRSQAGNSMRLAESVLPIGKNIGDMNRM